jgi:KEOPS complex subunit Cgi121
MRASEGNREISILGFKKVQVVDVNTFLEKIKTAVFPATIQLMDAMKIAGRTHLFFAFLNAHKSIEKGLAISANLEMETLLYASGTRQIVKAIEMLGVKPSTTNIAAIVFGSNEKEVQDAENKLIKLISGIRDDSVLEVKDRSKIENLMKTFGVTELEIKTVKGSEMTLNEALTWLIVERGSLLSIKH